MTPELTGRTYELVGGGDDEVEHVADAVGLEEAVARVGGVPLQLAHREPLQPLQVLVRRPRRLQHRGRHRPPAGLHPPLLRHLLAEAACHSSRAAERREGGESRWAARVLGDFDFAVEGREDDDETEASGDPPLPLHKMGGGMERRVRFGCDRALWIGDVGLCLSGCHFMGQFLPASIGVQGPCWQMFKAQTNQSPEFF